MLGCGGRSERSYGADEEAVRCDPASVHPDTLIARRDADLEALRGVTEIEGALRITDKATDLSPLACLARVGGDLELDAASLTSLDGLGSLEAVGGKVTFRDLPLLTSLGDLGSLREIVWLEIDHDASLTDLRGLDELTLVQSDITLSNNDALTSLRGLEALSRVGGNVVIMDNPALPTCETDRLIAGISIGGFAAISGNDDRGVCP